MATTFNYVTLQQSIISLFTTTTLNQNLQSGRQFSILGDTSTSQIIQESPFQKPIEITRYPIVFMDLESKTESFKAIGTASGGACRQIEINYSLYPVVVHQDVMTSKREIMYLVANVEEVLRGSIIINNRNYWAMVTDVDFVTFDQQRDHVSMAQMKYEIRSIF